MTVISIPYAFSHHQITWNACKPNFCTMIPMLKMVLKLYNGFQVVQNVHSQLKKITRVDCTQKLPKSEFPQFP